MVQARPVDSPSYDGNIEPGFPCFPNKFLTVSVFHPVVLGVVYLKLIPMSNHYPTVSELGQAGEAYPYIGIVVARLVFIPPNQA